LVVALVVILTVFYRRLTFHPSGEITLPKG
jgi:hypothetical protein